MVLWRALPGDAATVVAARGGVERWGVAELLLDEIRRDQVAVATRGQQRPDAMVGSPFAKTPAEAMAEAQRRRRAHEEAEAANAARLERLRALEVERG